MASEKHEFIMNMAVIQFNMLKILVRKLHGSTAHGRHSLDRRILLKRISEEKGSDDVS
jgi:hypothetical protein